MKIAKVGSLFTQAAADWIEDKAPRLGAALAYYTIFSLAPLLLLVITLAGLVFDTETAQGSITAQMKQLVGNEGAAAIQNMVEGANQPGTGIVSAILGTAMLLFGAAGLFGQLQDALNTIWEVPPQPSRGIWGFIQNRFLSFSMVLGTAFLLLVSLVVSAGLAVIVSSFGWEAEIVGHFVNELVSAVVITVLFAMIFRYLPDTTVAWRDVWLGAALTALLFEAGKFLIGLYLGHAAIASAFGAAGSLAVLLVWLYYSAQIFLFGAELTQVSANRRTAPAAQQVQMAGSRHDVAHGVQRPSQHLAN